MTNIYLYEFTKYYVYLFYDKNVNGQWSQKLKQKINKKRKKQTYI
jgi:hypothetical protein